MNPEPLNDATPPPPQWRHHLRRVIFALLAISLVIAAGVALERTLGPIWWRWKVQRARKLCEIAAIPPLRKAMEFDGKNYYVFRPAPRSAVDNSVDVLGSHGFADDLVFVHQRRTKSGAAFIVIVRINRLSFGPEHAFFSYEILGPPTPVDSSGHLASDDVNVMRRDDSIWIAPYADHPLTIYSGAPDPADQSHFTIIYEMDGRAGTIDGYLIDNPKSGWAPYLQMIDRKSMATTAVGQ